MLNLPQARRPALVLIDGPRVHRVVDAGDPQDSRPLALESGSHALQRIAAARIAACLRWVLEAGRRDRLVARQSAALGDEWLARSEGSPGRFSKGDGEAGKTGVP